MQDFSAELIDKVGRDSLSNTEDLSNFVLCCSFFYKTIQPHRIESKKVRELTDSVMHGAPDEKYMIDNPALILKYTNAIDYSGRNFPRISPFKYSLWALELTDTIPLMLNYVAQSENKVALARLLLQQYRELKQEGVLYHLNGKEHQEKSFNPCPLIDAMQAFINKFEYRKRAERISSWSRIRLLQKELTVNFARRYCTKEENPNSLNYYNHFLKRDDFWYSDDDNAHAIYRGNRLKPSAANGAAKNLLGIIQEDLDALRAQYKSRQEAFDLVEQQLLELCDSNQLTQSI